MSKQDVTTQVADQDGCAPDDFYSTTNHETHVRKGGKWTLVADQRMDAAIVIDGSQRGVQETTRHQARATPSSAASKASASCRRSRIAIATASRS